MLGASPEIRSFPHQPHGGSTVDTPNVERAVAVCLIRNFLTAIEAEGGATSPFMEYAQRRAEWQLEEWGEPVPECMGQSAA